MFRKALCLVSFIRFKTIMSKHGKKSARKQASILLLIVFTKLHILCSCYFPFLSRPLARVETNCGGLEELCTLFWRTLFYFETEL